MKKVFELLSSLIMICLFAQQASAQVSLNVDLEVKGSKVHTVTHVEQLPITIIAPAGGSNYVWLHPSTIKSIQGDKRNSIVINSAPKGAFEIKVSYVIIDFDKKTVEDRVGLVNIQFETPGPNPPGPTPPGPDDPFSKALLDAYIADATVNKKAILQDLAEVYKQGSEIVSDTNITTMGQLRNVMGKTQEALRINHALLPLQKVIHEELVKQGIYNQTNAKLDQLLRQNVTIQFSRVSQALSKLARE